MSSAGNSSVSQAWALGVIWAYRRVISPWLPPACRFHPTCSEYAGEAIQKYGVIRGGARALGRLLRCHPFHRGGVDLLD